MNHEEYKRARKVIADIARRNGVSETAMRRDMEEAIRQGVERSQQYGDRAALDKWNSIPHKGELPTPEELIVWTSKQADLLKYGNFAV